MPFASGTRLGRYEIKSPLGAGGMGEVYLAEDTELERQVALKILLAEVATDEDRVRRFVQEAKAASALNHPNILTVYEIGSFENSRFIATELIKGETLRERLQTEPLTLRETLDVAVQIASALNAAHAAGIVHRDIKPENVMLRDDGLAKVLDFGLAKLTDKKIEPLDTEGETRAQVKTSPGVVMGTVAYMSPEQARGKEIDTRSDVWSLGVVVYEMLTRRTPFAGETANDTIAAILTREPAPLDESTPTELQRIIRKALQKSRDERYQTVKDLLLDLKNLKRELDFAEEIERSQIPPFARAANVGTSQLAENATAILPAATSTQQGLSQPTSSTEYLVSEIKRHKRGAALGSIILLALIGAGSWFIFDRAAGNKQIESIAVMPFVNDSGDPDIEYLSEGMTETLINGLSQVPDLSVKARSSVFRYKGKEPDPRTIAKELGVEAVLNGRLVKRGDQLTLNVELIDGATENVLWGNRYERKLSDLVQLQSDVARDVSTRLKSRLSGAEEAKVTKSYTTNPKAFELYLKGRYFSRQFTLDGFNKGIKAFNQAIAVDPNYALAYSGLSDAYFYASTIHLPPTEALPKVGEYAQKALTIDDSLAAAHHSIANYKANYQRDNPGAKREFERALELDPHDSSIYFDYSQLLANIGESEPAIALAQKGKLVDPQDPYISYTLAQAYVLSDRYDEGLQETQTTIKLDDKNWWGYYWRAVAYSEKGMSDDAISAAQSAAKLDDSPLIRGVLACSLARAGRRAEAQHAIDDLISASKSKFVSQSSIAMGYAGMGETDKAFEWLDKSLESHDEAILWVYKHPMFAPLRSDPRYKELLKRLSLTQ